MIRWILERTIVVSAFLFLVFQGSVAQIKTDSSDGPEVLVESFVISGTQSIDSAELAEITNSMAGSKFADEPDELEERVKAQFQDHGYFAVTIQKLDIKTLDPIASPKPVRLGAQVIEGPHYRLSRIEFIGNHALARQHRG